MYNELIKYSNNNSNNVDLLLFSCCKWGIENYNILLLIM